MLAFILWDMGVCKPANFLMLLVQQVHQRGAAVVRADYKQELVVAIAVSIEVVALYSGQA